jgi:hypothetical protein
MAERRSRRRVVGPPAGIEHAYDVISAEVARQLGDAENLDRKLAVATAALIAVAGAIYAARPPALVAGVIASWLLVALVQGVRGFLYDDRFGEGVNQQFLDERLDLDPIVIKWHEYVVLKEVQTSNRALLDRKGRFLSQVTITLGLVAGISLLAKSLGVS